MLTIYTMWWRPKADQIRYLPSQTRHGEVRSPYTDLHVNALYAGVRDHTTVPFHFICFTDEEEHDLMPDIEVLPMWDDHQDQGSAFRKVKMWDPAMREIVGPRSLFLDLDQIVVGDLDPILKLKDPIVYWEWTNPANSMRVFNSSFVMTDTGCRPFVWDDFHVNPERAIAESAHLIGDDQAWMQWRLGLRGEGMRALTKADGILDFRVDIEAGNWKEEPPPYARIVSFPGPRDPIDKRIRHTYPWVQRAFNRAHWPGWS